MNKIIEYVIRAKDSTGNAIRNAVSRIRNFAQAVGSNLMNIKAGFDMLSGVVQKFAGVFKAALTEAFKFEKATSDFKVLLGSIDEAKAHIADLRRFASSTPLTFEDLSKASKLLLSFGASVESVMPSMKMLGDIAMGDRQKFQGLALVFAQVKAAGRLMGQDLLQMINQGFNPLTVIAKETGKSVAELRDMMAEGSISFEMVAEAMRVATSEGGLFNNAMGEAAKTGEGLISTLQDKWADAVRTFGEAFTDTAKGGIQTLIDKLTELVESGEVEEWASLASEKMYEVAEAAKYTGGMLSKIGIGIWKGVKATFGTALAFGAGADESRDQGGSFWEQVKHGAEVAKEMWHQTWNGDDESPSSSGRRKRRRKANSADAVAEQTAQAAEQTATLSEMMAAAEQKNIEKAEREREKELARLAKEEERQRLEIERAIAQERERLQRKMLDEYREELRLAQDEQARAASRLDAATANERQAWGWYRDKDSFRQQMQEEAANAEAERQFEKDFQRLKRKRYDWRTASEFGSGEMRSLSLDETAVKRVALAREEKEAAAEYARETAEATAHMAEVLDQINSAVEQGGE